MRGSGIVTNAFSTRAIMNLLLNELEAISANERTPARGLLLLQARADLLLIEEMRLLLAVRSSRLRAQGIAQCRLERQALAFDAEKAAQKWDYEAVLPLDFTERSIATCDNRWLWNDMLKRDVYETPQVTIEEAANKWRETK